MLWRWRRRSSVAESLPEIAGVRGENVSTEGGRECGSDGLRGMGLERVGSDINWRGRWSGGGEHIDGGVGEGAKSRILESRRSSDGGLGDDGGEQELVSCFFESRWNGFCQILTGERGAGENPKFPTTPSSSR
jgi:hypothetical protein